MTKAEHALYDMLKRILDEGANVYPEHDCRAYQDGEVLHVPADALIDAKQLLNRIDRGHYA